MPLPASNTQVSQNAKTYKVFEITPENLSQIQNAMEYTYIIPAQPAK